ncbi:hypothetical protein [Kocuria carniphila]|uniref:hypothetical protein n=1 Tax=Kocuria carniphila TaxID=262208 RepID=UPI00101D89C4|nr:hypothetical protein [Kocuria carniphila]
MRKHVNERLGGEPNLTAEALARVIVRNWAAVVLSELGQGVAFGSELVLPGFEVFEADRLREIRDDESVLLSEVLRTAGGELSRFFLGRDGEPYGRKRSTLL